MALTEQYVVLDLDASTYCLLGLPYNHKRVYRIYRELELNLRIKHRRRIKRAKPVPLAIPVKTQSKLEYGLYA